MFAGNAPEHPGIISRGRRSADEGVVRTGLRLRLRRAVIPGHGGVVGVELDETVDPRLVLDAVDAARSLVRAIICRHGGEASLRSDHGVGTPLRLDLPR